MLTLLSEQEMGKIELFKRLLDGHVNAVIKTHAQNWQIISHGHSKTMSQIW
jgi:hypothetical protein